MLELTHLALLLVCAVFAQFTHMAGLLMVSMVLQAGSILNVYTPVAAATGTQAYGVTVFHAAALLVVLSAFWRLFRLSRPVFPLYLRWPFSLLLAYVIVAVAGSWLLPKIFSGLQVNALIQMQGVFYPSPLVWNFGHAVQAVSIMLLFCVLCSIWLLCSEELDKNRLLVGVALGCGLVLVLGFYEQLAPHVQLPSVADYWANNPGYSQAPLAPMGFVLNRIGLPFSEPSYASAYMAAVLVGVLAVALFGRRGWSASLAVLLCTLGLLNTLGSTGIAAALLAVCVLVLWALISAFRPFASRDRRLRLSLFVIVVLLIALLGTKLTEKMEVNAQVGAMVKGLLVDKAMGRDSSSPRAITNWRALELTWETFGLGVGMGSQRSSSFFASLLANTGIVGFVLFMGMLVTLLWRYWMAPNLTDSQIFTAASLSTATLAMGLGIPDLNMPMYWGFIILGFVFCPDDAQIKVRTV